MLSNNTDLEAILEQYPSLPQQEKQEALARVKEIKDHYQALITSKQYQLFVPKNPWESNIYDLYPFFTAVAEVLHKYYPAYEGKPKKNLEMLFYQSYDYHPQQLAKRFLTKLLTRYKEEYYPKSFQDLAYDIKATAMIWKANLKETRIGKWFLEQKKVLIENQEEETQQENKQRGNTDRNTHSKNHQIYEFFNPEIYYKKPEKRLDEIIGYEKEKEAILEILNGLQYPEIYQRRGADRFGVNYKFLLIGPPGVGKSVLSEAIANYYGLDFLRVGPSELFDKYWGNSEKIIKALLDYLAEQKSQTLLFLDEIDALGMKKDDHDRAGTRFLATLLPLIDDNKKYKDIILFGATSKPNLLDGNIYRRFNKIVLPLPQYEQRKAIFQYYCEPLQTTLDYHTLASGTEGFTGHDIREIVRRAANKFSYLESKGIISKDTKITTKDLLIIIEEYAQKKDLLQETPWQV